MGAIQNVNTVWNSHQIETLTKLEIDRVLIISIATYASKT